MERQLVVKLPTPHGQQARIKSSNAQRKVILAGRRGGKTTFFVETAVESFLAGYRVLEAAPTGDQTEAFWAGCCAALEPLINARVVYKNESLKILELIKRPTVSGYVPSESFLTNLGVGYNPNRPRIRAKTAWNADTLRGDYADLLLLDEYSIMSPDTWEEVGAPMLLDNGGTAIFAFTPKRKNHAFLLYNRAQADTSGRWASFHFTSHDNPYLDKDALAEITQDLTEEAYRQEILAEFLESDGAVFRNVAACTKGKPSSPSLHEGHHIIIGCDWARQSDYTCFSVGCRNCGCEVELDRFNKIEYHLQLDRLIALCDKWDPKSVLTEVNSMGLPLFESAQRERLPVVSFYTDSASKPPLIQNLALSLEKSDWMWISHPIANSEMEAYEGKTSASGRIVYGAPSGMHDDTVMARALVRWQAGNRGKSSMRQAKVRGRGGDRMVRRAIMRLKRPVVRSKVAA